MTPTTPRPNRATKNGTLEWVPTDRCVMLSHNPQRLTPKQIAGLKRSIERDGFIAPILVRPLPDERFEVISGNHRVLAAQALGMQTLPAVVKPLDDRAVKRIAVNLNTIHGDPTAEALAPFLTDLDTAMLAEVYLDAAMIDALGAVDADLAEKLAALSGTKPLEPPSPPVGISLTGGLRYQVIVACADESMQCALLDRFAEEGLECRALIS